MQEEERIAEAKLNPRRVFDRPMDVVEDGGMSASEKLAVLRAWGGR